MQTPPVSTEVVYWTDLILGPKGLAVMMIVILYGVIKDHPWWVPGHIYRRTEQKLDALSELVAANTVLVARTATAAAEEKRQREATTAAARMP